MGRLKLDAEVLGLSSLMEKLTGAKVLDCFRAEGTVYMVVASGELGKAVGRNGENVRKVQETIQKPVRVIEYREDVAGFVRNIVYPLQVEEIAEEDGRIIIRDQSKKTKSLLIGRGGRNLEIINRAVRRFFNTEVKVG